MTSASTPEIVMSSMPRPPEATGLSSELARVAPSGRVRTNAVQNSIGLETRVRSWRAVTTTSATRMRSALPLYPSPLLSAIQSPNAVPSVWENMTVAQ